MENRSFHEQEKENFDDGVEEEEEINLGNWDQTENFSKENWNFSKKLFESTANLCKSIRSIYFSEEEKEIVISYENLPQFQETHGKFWKRLDQLSSTLKLNSKDIENLFNEPKHWKLNIEDPSIIIFNPRNYGELLNFLEMKVKFEHRLYFANRFYLQVFLWVLRNFSIVFKKSSKQNCLYHSFSELSIQDEEITNERIFDIFQRESENRKNLENEIPSLENWKIEEILLNKINDTSKIFTPRIASLPALCEQIKQNKVKKIVIISGAGISTSSGIPDFRSKGGAFEHIKYFCSSFI